MKEKLNQVLAPLLRFADGIGQRRLTVYASSGCYYLFMSLVPIVMIVCCILQYTPLSQDVVLEYVDGYFSESLGDVILNIVNAVYASNAATLTISILMTLWSASASMKAIIKGIDAAYGMHRKENIIVFSVKSLFYMIVLIVSLIVSLIIMVYGDNILGLLKRYLPELPSLPFFNQVLSASRFLLIMIFLAVIFEFLFTFGTAKNVRFWAQIPGAVFSAVTWVGFSAVFSWYVRISNKYGAYGIIGTVMVAMLWMYYCLFFLLIGGYINSCLYVWRKGKTVEIPAVPEDDV